MRNLETATNGKAHDLYHDFKEIKSKASETKDAILKTAHHAKDNAGGLLQDSFESIKDKSANLQGDVEKYVKTHPIRSVGFAVLAGLILSQLFRK